MKIGIQEKINEARRFANKGVSCGCLEGPTCTHGNATWLVRAEKLGTLRGEMAVAVYNMRTKPNFWEVVDQLSAAPKQPSPKKTPVTKSTPGVSLKAVVRKLQQKAKDKSHSGECECSPEEDCPHLQATPRDVWATRLKKLRRIAVEDAQPLLPHVGSTGIWDAVDRLDLRDKAAPAGLKATPSPSETTTEPSPVTEQTDRGFVW